MYSFFTQISGRWCSIWSIIYTLSVHIKYNDKNVTTKYTPIVGIDVSHSKADCKNEFNQVVIVFNNSVVDLSIAPITLSGILSFFKFSPLIKFWINVLAFVKYVPKLSNKFEPSEISVLITHINNPSIIPITTIIIIIELDFLFNLHFLIKNLIAGSNNKDIIKAIKNGI